jgi:hypothetical protein
MYDKTQILSTDGLYTRIGVKEPTKTGYTGILDTEAKTTKSGFYYDKYHSLANFVNIYDCQNDPEISNAEINADIANWRKEAIEHGLNLVFYDRPDLIQSDYQFKNENALDTPITNNSKFVGFEITVPNVDTILNVLNSIVFQFNGAASFKLYLFHSSKKEAIDTEDVTTVEDDFYSLSLSWSLYGQSSLYTNGKFYVGYFQDDLGTVQAYDRRYNNASIETSFPCLYLRPFTVEPNGTDLFDIADIQYTSECFGMNLKISSFHDYTSVILGNQEVFDDIQGYAFAIRVLELIKTSGRLNPVADINKNLPNVAQFELENQGGDVPRSTGLQTKLQSAVKRVRKSLFQTDKVLSYIPQ